MLRDPNEPVTSTAAEAVPTPAAAPASRPTPKATVPPRSANPFPDFTQLEDSPFDDDVPAIFAGPPAAKAPSASPLPFPVGSEPPQSNASPTPFPSSIPAAGPIVPVDADEEILSPLKKKKSGKAFQIGLFAVLGLAGIGMAAFFLTQEKPAPTSAATLTQSTEAESPGRPLDPNQPYSKPLLERDKELVAEFKPTSGQPIEMLMMPSGVNLLIHLRPAQLWSESYNYKVLHASLTDDLMSWMRDQIKGLCRRDPEQIEELTIGVLLGARGTPPQYCCVVRLVEPERLSTLIESFPGKYLYEITERPDLRIKVDDQHGYLIQNEKTFAICPAAMAGDLEYSIDTPNTDIGVGMAEMLKRTDRQRLCTMIADVNDLEIHSGTLVPAAAQPFLTAATEWLGENIETVSWSLQPEPYFHSEIALRPVNTMEVARLDNEVKGKLNKLPETVWKDLCAKMQPREMRFRKLIGRLPAMLAAVTEATVSQRENRCVLLTTVLPAKATPNLALATMFAIDEATRTNFAQATVASSSQNKPTLPETVAERMKLPVDAEFNRTPLEQALTYLCGEIQVKLFVDGDALKDAGYTKNMPQTFNLGKVPMQRALFEIVNAYQEDGKEMVISVDEATKSITVLTKKFADAKGLPVFPLKAE
ncbi:hypothetical protein SH661x_003639 [Planctomicrobium sp. SH661]|uniref:hypothetical protein n=1 Tax=Planctomicrobium sp. SH661 TaxID=3448124 RepID=UPI003F5B07CD